MRTDADWREVTWSPSPESLRRNIDNADDSSYA